MSEIKFSQAAPEKYTGHGGISRLEGGGARPVPRPQPQRVHSGHGGHGSDAAGYQAARFCRFVTENEIQIIENLENSISCFMSGGYSYKNDTDSSILANRTLYWRTHGDSLELITGLGA